MSTADSGRWTLSVSSSGSILSGRYGWSGQGAGVKWVSVPHRPVAGRLPWLCRALHPAPVCGVESVYHRSFVIRGDTISLLPTYRESLLSEPNDLWNSFAPAGLAPMPGSHLVRVEDAIDDDRYVVRTEIPGVDPAKDIDVSVHGRQLVIKAQRTEKKTEKGYSEGHP